MTDPRTLQHFAMVFRRGSFRGAAEHLNVAQSTLTKSIQRLERELGLQLFNRTTRTVEPTDAARQLLPRAEAALRAGDLFEAEARLLAGGALGGIRVGAIALAAEALIPDALARLSRVHPGLEVEVVVGVSDLYGDLADGQFDVAIGDEANFAASPHAVALSARTVRTEELVFVHRKGHPDVRGQRLLRNPLAVPSRYFSENRLFEAQTARQLAPRYRLNSLSACLALVAESDVISLAPRSVVTRQIEQQRSPALAIAARKTGIHVRLSMLTVARNAQTPALRAFAEALL